MRSSAPQARAMSALLTPRPRARATRERPARTRPGAGELASGMEFGGGARQPAEVSAARGAAHRGGAEPGAVEVEERGAPPLGAGVDEDVAGFQVGGERARRVQPGDGASRGGREP